MSPFSTTNREAFAQARASLAPPVTTPVGLGHLLLAAAFAASAAVASAAAIILGVPGIDRSAIPEITRASGAVHLTAPHAAAPQLIARR